MKNLLLVEDDPSLGPSLERFLNEEGYNVSLATNLETARKQVSESHADIIVLDWMLPDGQGVDFLKEIRQNGKNTPVIMLTAKTELIDKVLGLESGANDYMTKPFEPRELGARIRVQLRDRANPQSLGESEVLEVSGVTIDFTQREVKFMGEIIDLTKMEFELLRLLLESPNRVFSRDEILNKVWGYDNFPSTRTVDTHILQLRQKFSDDLIETIRGVGYRLRKLES